MSYFVIELCSIGGCPLKEASEHYSLNNKFIAILCSGYLFSHILYSGSLFFAYSVFGYHLQVKSITSGIRALSRAGGISIFLPKKILARDMLRRL